MQRGDSMFIARQPIFDRSMNVYGYELLYRANEQSTAFGQASALTSTATVLGGLFEIGLKQIVGDKRAFINFDYEFLMSDAILLIHPQTLIIEVLETVQVDDALIHRILELRKLGYKIALDDFAENISDYSIVPMSDIIKYDLMVTPSHTIKKDVEYAKRKGKFLLAEKIETIDDFLLAKEMGFLLFQGYFFSKPKIVAGLKTKNTVSSVYQRLISELREEEPSYQKLADIISMDVNMAYRVMKVSGQKAKDKKTIRDALTRMGLKELERWISVLMLQELSKDKPQELVKVSLIRSKFGELIAANSIYAKRKYEISLMCLFSVLDAMLDLPMEEALEGISLSEDVKKLLIKQEGDLITIYQIIHCYESGECKDLKEALASIKLDPEKLFQSYLEAIKWSDEVLENV